MTDKRRDEKKMPRRSLIKSAMMLGGGAAFSSTIAPLALGERAGITIPGQDRTPDILQVGPAPQTSTAGSQHFSKAFLQNEVFGDLPLSFTPPSPLRIQGRVIETGATVQSNGDVRFRIYAPSAQEITLSFTLSRTENLFLTKMADGTFEAILPFADNHTGPTYIDISIDGTIVVDPYIPVLWADRPRNFIDIPDNALEFILIKNVPHGGVTREIYWADAVQTWQRCLVYTPPGYMKSTHAYPVVYLQHGFSENENAWEFCGKVAYIMDNLIAEVRVTPFLIVMNNAMVRFPSTPDMVVDKAYEQILTESCIPYLEQTYRIKTGRLNRAIAGLSMGAYMSCDIGMNHPELFANIGTFTASMTHTTLHMSYPRPYLSVLRDAKKFAQNYKVFFRSTTPAEDHLDYFLADDALCAVDGIDKLPGYHRVLYPGRVTRWNSWRMGFRDFAQLLFR